MHTFTVLCSITSILILKGSVLGLLRPCPHCTSLIHLAAELESSKLDLPSAVRKQELILQLVLKKHLKRSL